MVGQIDPESTALFVMDMQVDDVGEHGASTDFALTQLVEMGETADVGGRPRRIVTRSSSRAANGTG